MGVPALHVGATVMCPHAGTVSISPGSPRVKVAGQPVATLADVYSIAGCPFQVPVGAGTKPQPCIQIQWMVTSLRVKAGGSPLVLQNSTGLCLSAESIPGGPPNPTVVQPRVKAL